MTGMHTSLTLSTPTTTLSTARQASLPMKYTSDAYRAFPSPSSTAPTAEPTRALTATISPIATLPVNSNNEPTSSFVNSTPHSRPHKRAQLHLSDALLGRSKYVARGWVWVNNTAATTRQGLRKGADNKVLKEKLFLNLTDPFKIIDVGPSPAHSQPDGRPLGDTLLYLGLPSNMSGPAAKPCVAVGRCKPCANPHDADDMSR